MTGSRGGRVPASVKVLYGIGDVSIAVQMVLFGMFVLFFYNSVLGVPATLVGIASAVGLVWDAVIDPYIGYRSDRSTSRLGRRHAPMVVGASTMGACWWLLLTPPESLGVAGAFAWLLVATIAFRFTSALYRIPYLSLGAELTSDYHERTVVVAIRSFFGLCGTLAAASLSFLLFFPATTSGVDPKLDREGYAAMGVAYGLVMTVCGLVAVGGTRSWGSAANSAEEAPQYWSAFMTAWRNVAFRRVWISFTVFFLAIVLTVALSIHYYTWYVRITDGSVLGSLQTALYLGSLGGVFVWMWLGRRFTKHRLCVAAMLGTAFLLVLATLLFGEGRAFGTGDAMPLLLGHALAGLTLSALWVLPASMLADVADCDAIDSGSRREGTYFGLLNLGEKVAAGFALLIAGVLLDLFVGLEPGTSPSPTATDRLGMLFGLVPALLLTAAAWPLLRYDLDGERLARQRFRATLDGDGAAVWAPGGRAASSQDRVARINPARDLTSPSIGAE